jgi:succinyl-CoA synthetase alpha subunit
MNFHGNTRVLVQGIHEPLGSTHTVLMQAYGTKILAGVSPGRGGQTFADIPVFDTVDQAIEAVGMVDSTVIFAQPYQVMDETLEAIAAGIRQVVMISDGVPPMDIVRLIRKAEMTETLLVGPTCPGVIVPNEILLGTHPTEFYTPGSIGIISRSGTLTYEIAWELTQAQMGQSIVVSIGGDYVVGSSFQQWLQILEEDERTEVIVLVGEIGGDSEEVAAHYIAETIDKPVVAYIAGHTAPRGQPMGHTSAIITAQTTNIQIQDVGTVASKVAAFEQAGVPVATRPSELPNLIRRVLQSNPASTVESSP